jgi:hypothetical protein
MMMMMTMTTTLMLMVLQQPSNVAHAELTCTHGKLYVSEADTTNVHIYDLNGSMENLTPETTLSMTSSGPELYFGQTGSKTTVATIYRGVIENGYVDGAVSFIDTGLTIVNHGDHSDIEYKSASALENAGITCARPIHFVPHHGMFVCVYFHCDVVVMRWGWVGEKFGNQYCSVAHYCIV